MVLKFLSFCVFNIVAATELMAQGTPGGTSTTTTSTSTGAPAEAWWNSTPIGLILMLGVFFFLIILPQSKKAKKQAQFLASLQRGDAVITSGGLYGKIYGLTDRIVTLEIAPNVRIRVDRQVIVSKDTSATAADKAEVLQAAGDK